MILWTSWFSIQDEEHRNEVLRTIELNLENPYIEKLKLLCEIDFLYKHPKLDCIRILERPTYQTFVDMFDLSKINTIANSDIVFDYESTSKINQIQPGNGYVITRYNLYSDYREPLTNWKGRYWHEVSGLSQDAWVIYNPPKKIIADFYPGILGCENRFTLSMYKAGLNLSNLGPSIKTFHVHKTDKRNYLASYQNQNFPGMTVSEAPKFKWGGRPRLFFTSDIFSADRKDCSWHPFNQISDA
jgi:hypothetical protein